MMRRPPIATRTYTRFPYPTRFRSLTILHGDDHRALGARLADRATLDVAREDDMRRLAHDLVLMDMAERPVVVLLRSEEHTSALQSLMRISYAVFCLPKKNITTKNINQHMTMHQEIHHNHPVH